MLEWRVLSEPSKSVTENFPISLLFPPSILPFVVSFMLFIFSW